MRLIILRQGTNVTHLLSKASITSSVVHLLDPFPCKFHAISRLSCVNRWWFQIAFDRGLNEAIRRRFRSDARLFREVLVTADQDSRPFHM